jgi:acyl-CoA thioesterase
VAETEPGESRVRAMFATDVGSRALGIELLSAAGGTATARMRITDEMLNGHGIAHGGYLFTLADTAFACACNSRGPTTVAASASITFVASAGRGDELVAEAIERTRFGRNGLYDVTVYRVAGGEREVIAEFRGHSRAIRDGTTS